MTISHPITHHSFNDLLTLAKKEVDELFPWDVEELIEEGHDLLIIDVREPYEYKKMRIKDSINVPRGVLETACEWAFDETVPELVMARNKKVLVVCRSGNRSVFAVQTLAQMGFKQAYSLQTGLRGWNEYDMPLVNDDGEVDVDDADVYHESKISPEQMGPQISEPD
ncbi:MAG: rhodanese-like domain-containing protein [Gammaproteobacteria bacterium]|nr:rhodanese-like domain-containing protein [Gammaproteobacteria bacterium]